MARYLARNIASQEIERVCITQEPFDLEGPPYLTPYLQDDIELIAWEGAVSLTPATPTAKLRWDGTGAAWVEEADLIALKARKSEEINAARLLANQSYFDFAGKEIACDEVSMLDIQCINAEVALTRKIPASFPGYWKTRDNTYTSIPDVATWTLFIQAMVTRGAAHFDHAQKLKADLAVAATPSQVGGITW